MPPAYRLVLLPAARKLIDSQPPKLRRQLAEKIGFLLTDPWRPGTRQLRGDHLVDGLPVRRIRCGDYRILYTVRPETETVTVVAAGPRRDIYR